MITDSRGSTRSYPKANVRIQLQGEQEFSQEVAVVVKHEQLERDTPIGVP